MKRLLSLVARGPPRTTRFCWRPARAAEHAAREGVWLAIEPINRCKDYMTNRLE